MFIMPVPYGMPMSCIYTKLQYVYHGCAIWYAKVYCNMKMLIYLIIKIVIIDVNIIYLNQKRANKIVRNIIAN